MSKMYFMHRLLNPIPDPNPPKCQQLESGKKGECSKTSSASSSSASSLEQVTGYSFVVPDVLLFNSQMFSIDTNKI